MHQLTQKLKSGHLRVIEVPLPTLPPHHVLVRNHYSLISAGTEAATVRAARMNLLDKARARPQQVKQVLEVVRTQGLLSAYRAVMKKLEAHAPLGYSCAGEIIEVGPGVSSLSVGDRVACGGLSASHAEVVSVPVNLCVKLHADADLRQAAYNTLGAIALQGVRQADLRLGETCAVIGLGLIGQLTCLLLRASGVRVIGVDRDDRMVQIAASHCADIALARHTAGIEERISNATGGLGCDGVIITAASQSLDPINFAGAIARKKGTVVIVGDVPTGFDREPHYYRKELQIRMSCSYGPGRYDPMYEEKGIDYPPAYVRWTERRNMEAFQELIRSRKIDVSYLTTHIFKLEEAPRAYDLLLSKSEPYVGILIAYDVDSPIAREKIVIPSGLPRAQPSAIGIGFIGAGSYAQSHLLPHLPRNGSVRRVGVMTASGTGSRSVADRFGFEFCTGDEKDLLENPQIQTIFIATRHDSHAGYVLKALKAGKHVFVEKPLCITLDDLNRIARLVFALRASPSDLASPDPPTSSPTPLPTPHPRIRPLLMVGYNRRFSPLARILKGELGDGPMAMIYRVNAGAIPPDSWIQDPERGGGRVIGEVGHFVDFLTFMSGSLPNRVYGQAMGDARGLGDVLNISLSFENGSIGTIAYLANGDKALPKERVEIFAHGCTAILDDFKSLTLFVNGRKRTKNLLSQDKGQRAEVLEFLDAIRQGGDGPIPFEELYRTSLATFQILESIRTGKSRVLSPWDEQRACGPEEI